MSGKENSSEQLIKDTAKHLFFVQGRFNATTQEIADAAGVNRTLVHYYFRSRDALFEMVYKEAVANMREVLKQGMTQVYDNFEKKVEGLLDLIYREINAKPYLEVFFISEINKRPEDKILGPYPGQIPDFIESFLQEVSNEMEKGNVMKMNPLNFVANLFSLVCYPVVTKRIYVEAWGVDAAYFEEVLRERKTLILQLIFKKNI